MKISTKGRYAMRLLIDLYENQGDGFVALKDIAARQDISKKYLEQIVPALTGDGILKTSRGFQGGYRLARASRRISLSAIYCASPRAALRPWRALTVSPTSARAARIV